MTNKKTRIFNQFQVHQNQKHIICITQQSHTHTHTHTHTTPSYYYVLHIHKYSTHLQNVCRHIVQYGHDVLHQVQLYLVAKHFLHTHNYNAWNMSHHSLINTDEKHVICSTVVPLMKDHLSYKTTVSRNQRVVSQEGGPL